MHTTSDIAAVERFVINLSAAMGKRLMRETAAMYVERIARWGLNDQQLAHVLSRLVGDKDHWPTLHEIFPYLLKASLGDAAELAPVWATMESNGKQYAAKTGEFVRFPPSAETWRKWRLEQVHGAEALEAFKQGFIEAGGRLDKLAMIVGAIQAKSERERKPLDGLTFAEPAA